LATSQQRIRQYTKMLGLSSGLLQLFLACSFSGVGGIRLHDDFLEVVAEITAYRMRDILEFAIGQLPARHCYEITITAFDDLDIVHYKLAIERNGHISLKFSCLIDFPYTYF